MSFMQEKFKKITYKYKLFWLKVTYGRFLDHVYRNAIKDIGPELSKKITILRSLEESIKRCEEKLK